MTLILHTAAPSGIGAGIKLGIKRVPLESSIARKCPCLWPRRGGRAVESGGLEIPLSTSGMAAIGQMLQISLGAAFVIVRVRAGS